MKVLTEAEKAWLACAVDGEGYISLVDRIDPKTQWKQRYVEVGVVNTDVRFIEEAQRLLGSGGLRRKRPRARIGETSYAGKKDVFVVCVKQRDKVVAILQAIRSYLIIKRDKADAVIAFVRSTDWTRTQSAATRESKRQKMLTHWRDGSFTGSRGMRLSNREAV